ncbi:Cytochrome c [Roseovarius gaetbuli]|uniref:Cytochrome c n=1 Tax=Roseovarius gaetbuli TaxID=1356575 RepID=A0A1X6YS03_9RHOB|nr:c-type cytochrome [Roseovarius gaetbuli]SLN29188.1 Cytochrome c [Roseovarius gaetbuli]
MQIRTWAGMMAVLCLPIGAMAQDARLGKKTYERYCAACHGADASGNGPMRSVLTVAPRDLGALARNNGGAFPLARVVRQIDGREPMVAHGDPMPVYGDFFEGRDVVLKVEEGVQIRTSRQVVDLVAYLQRLQRR